MMIILFNIKANIGKNKHVILPLLSLNDISEYKNTPEYMFGFTCTMHVYIWIIIDFYAFLKLYLFLDFLLKKNSNLYSEMSFNESSHCPQITFYLFIYLSIYQMTIQVFQTVDLTTDI
jgi:hypothetical protein